MALLSIFRDMADAVFLLASLLLALISVALISSTFQDHLRNYKYPSMQMCCLRILALAPVYAILSWLMMVFLPLASFFEVFRDLYETYALYCYWVLLVLWVGGQRKAIDALAAVPDSTADCMVCPLLPAHGLPKVTGLALVKFQNAKSHFQYWRLALFQWMIVKPSLTLIHSILLAVNLGGLERARLLSLLSTFIGMHAVLDTYSCLLPHLKGLQGSTKFLCIKLVVWVTLFQQIMINALLGYGAIPQESGTRGYSPQERAQRLLSTVTIVEMAVFSLVLSYVFSPRSLQRAESDQSSVAKALQQGDSKVERSGKVSKSSKSFTPKGFNLQISDKNKNGTDLGGDPRHPQVMVGSALSSGDVISRQGRAASHVVEHEQHDNWDVDIETEDDLSERVSFRQVLALWDFVIWRTVEDRHAWALTGRSSPPPEREQSELKSISPSSHHTGNHSALPPSSKSKLSAA